MFGKDHVKSTKLIKTTRKSNIGRQKSIDVQFIGPVSEIVQFFKTAKCLARKLNN